MFICTAMIVLMREQIEQVWIARISWTVVGAWGVSYGRASRDLPFVVIIRLVNILRRLDSNPTFFGLLFLL